MGHSCTPKFQGKIFGATRRTPFVRHAVNTPTLRLEGKTSWTPKFQKKKAKKGKKRQGPNRKQPRAGAVCEAKLAHLLKAGFVERRLHDGRLRLPRDHAHALAHPLHALDDVVLPHVVDDTHHLNVHVSLCVHNHMQQTSTNTQASKTRACASRRISPRAKQRKAAHARVGETDRYKSNLEQTNHVEKQKKVGVHKTNKKKSTGSTNPRSSNCNLLCAERLGLSTQRTMRDEEGYTTVNSAGGRCRGRRKHINETPFIKKAVQIRTSKHQQEQGTNCTTFANQQHGTTRSQPFNIKK